MALLHGVDRDAAGAINMTASGTIILEHSIPVTVAGELRTTVITGSPPAGSRTVFGLSFASDGTIQCTTDAIALVVNGIAYTADRVLCHTTNAPDNNSKRAFPPLLGSVLVDLTGRVHVA
jgi:hypothetical protein